jgi:Tfp pilus assembly protein PilF
MGVAGSLDNLGMIAYDQGALDEAERLFTEALVMRREAGQFGGLSYSLEHMALLAIARGQPAAARQHLDEIRAMCAANGWTLSARIRNMVADVQRLEGRLQEAEHEYRAALQEALQKSNYPVALDSLVALAQVSLAWGEQTQAVRLLAHAAAHRAAEYGTRQRAQRVLAEAAAHMPAEAVAQATRWGQDVSFETLTAPYLALAT